MRKTKQIAIITYIICSIIAYSNIVKAESLQNLSLNKNKITLENQKILDQIYYNQQKIKKKQKISISKIDDKVSPISPDYDTVQSNNNFFIEIKKPSKGLKKKYQLYQQAYLAINSQQYELAIFLYKKILKTNPKDQLSLSSIALSYQKLGDIASAKQTYAKTIKLYPNNINTINNYLILIAQQHPEEALNELLKLDNLFSNNHKLKAQISYLYAQQKKYSAALNYINKALKIKKYNLTYLNNKAVILEYLGEVKKANIIYNIIKNQT